MLKPRTGQSLKNKNSGCLSVFPELPGTLASVSQSSTLWIVAGYMRQRAVNQQIAEETMEFRLHSPVILSSARRETFSQTRCRRLLARLRPSPGNLPMPTVLRVTGRQKRLNLAGLFSNIGGFKAFLFRGRASEDIMLISYGPFCDNELVRQPGRCLK